MATISWLTTVNTKILDSTTISMGEGGFVEDSSSNGYKLRRATSLAVPDKYNVTMDFDWLTKDADGNSEFDRFVLWYKYRHQYGANPFWFESVARFNINGPIVGSDGKPQMCKYKITSAPSFQKSGFCMRCTMTWEEVYSGIIAFSEPKAEVDYINAENGKIYVTYKNVPAENPTPTSYSFAHAEAGSVSINNFTAFTVTRAYLEGKVATFVVDKLTSGSYKIIIYNYEDSVSEASSITTEGRNVTITVS